MLSALCPIFPEGNGPAELQDNVSITSPTLPSTIVDRLPVPHPLVRAGVCVCVCARTCMSDRARVLNSMHFDVQAHDKTHRNSIPRVLVHPPPSLAPKPVLHLLWSETTSISHIISLHTCYETKINRWPQLWRHREDREAGHGAAGPSVAGARGRGQSPAPKVTAARIPGGCTAWVPTRGHEGRRPW